MRIAQGRKQPTIGTLPCDTVTFGVLVLAVLYKLFPSPPLKQEEEAGMPT